MSKDGETWVTVIEALKAIDKAEALYKETAPYWIKLINRDFRLILGKRSVNGDDVAKLKSFHGKKDELVKSYSTPAGKPPKSDSEKSAAKEKQNTLLDSLFSEANIEVN